MWLVVFSFVAAHVLLHRLGYFPFDYDSLMYHIPLVDHWLQTRGLNATDTAHWWLAANNELLALWIVGPFTGDFLIGLNNLPIFALWVASAIEIGRALRLPIIARHFGALAIVCVQPTLDQIARSANDLAVGVYWLAALCYALRYLRGRRFADLALFGVSVGLLGGVKYFATGYASALVAAAGFSFLRRDGWGRAMRDAFWAGLFAAPFGGYWYLRNLLATGSPPYPMGVGKASGEVGYPASLWSTTLLGNLNPDLPRAAWQMVVSVMGPCPTVCVIAAPLLILALLVWALWPAKTQARRVRSYQALLLLLTLLAAAVFLVTPFCVENDPGTLNQLYVGQTPARYGLCFWSTAALAALAVAYGFAQRHSSMLCRAFACATGGLALWQTYSRVARTWPWLSYYYGPSEIVLVAVNLVLSVLVFGAFSQVVRGPGPARILRSLGNLGRVALGPVK